MCLITTDRSLFCIKREDSSRNLTVVAPAMDYQQLANGLWAPSLPSREWDTHHLLGDVGLYKRHDAVKVIQYLYGTFESDVGMVFSRLLKLYNQVKIEPEARHHLVRKFLEYPITPALQAEEHAEPDQVLQRMWHDWAALIEIIYTDLTDTLGRSIRIPKERQEPTLLIEEIDPGISDNPSAADLWLLVLTAVELERDIKSLEQLGGNMKAVSFGRDGSKQDRLEALMDKMKKLGLGRD